MAGRGGQRHEQASARLAPLTETKERGPNEGLEMSVTAGQQGRTKPTRAGPATASAALEWLWQQLHDVPHPHMLDCGPICQATVDVLLRRGAKLYVTDLMTPAREGNSQFWDRRGKVPVFRLHDFLAQLPEIPEESLSAIFCWHLLDLLPRDVLPGLVDRFFSCLQPGGVLFCLLREPYLAAGAEMMWWLENLTTLATGREGNKPFPYPALSNREMERLARSRSIKAFLTRSGRREVLAIK